MFQIRFRGLMTHSTIERELVVVLFASEYHSPILMVEDYRDIIGDVTLPPVGSGINDITRCFELRGRVHISNVPAGRTTKLIAGVPPLSAFVQDPGPIRIEIVERIPHPDFATYIDLEGGLLLVEDWFDEQATFDYFSSVCVARTVLFTTTAYGDPVITATGADGAKSITLKRDARIVIGNVETTGSTTSPADHYGTFLKFFQSYGGFTVPRPTIRCDLTTPDTLGGCISDVDLGIECSNTQWP